MAALEFVLDPGDLPDLIRLPLFRRRGGRPASAEIIWHDTPAGALAAEQLGLAESRGVLRLERLAPVAGETWVPGTPPPVLAQAGDPSGLGRPLPEALVPVAGFTGTRRLLPAADLPGVTLTVLDGVVRGMAREQPSCRILLEGPAAALLGVSTALAEAVPIAVPRWSLGCEAIAFARRQAPPPRQTGAPEVPPGMTVADAASLVVGHLTDVLLAGAPAAARGEGSEPVHAMRVALRRLRSALSVFRKVTDGPALQALKPQLHELGQVLGAARDWDVFIEGTGQQVARALPDDPRLEHMLALAAKKRAAAYAALRRSFASPGFRKLAVELVQFAALRPWQLDADTERTEALHADAASYAAALLAKRHEHMLEPGADISALPAPDLHALRKRGKRLRYAAEFFAPCYGKRSTKRFVRGVSRLQEALGHLNDGAAAAELMAALRSGADGHFADGAVQGYAAARSSGAREAIAKSWARFRRTEPFWE